LAPLPVCLGVLRLPEAIKINLSERDDLADLLALVPQWVYGALFWVAISELLLKRLYPNDFHKLQTAVLGADYVTDMPAGVAMVAVIYETLHLVEIAEEDITKLDLVKLIVKVGRFFGVDLGGIPV